MKLSIITINYNNLEGLNKTAESVINQTWRDFEWIIVDGGSTDGSKEYIEELAADSTNNISHWYSEPDDGIYPAMNKGIKMASGEYLSFMNSGDTYFDSTTLKQFFNNKRISDIYYGHKVLISDNEMPLWVKAYTHMDLYDIAMSHLCQQSMFIKTGLLKEKGFDEKYKIAADLKRWVEFALQGVKFEYVDLTICKYDNSGVSAHNKKLFQKEKEEILSITIPVCVLELVFRNYRNEESHINKKCVAILEKGGLTSVILRALLKIF